MPPGRWLLRSFSLHIWGKLPARTQRALSKLYSSIYDRRWSRHLIGPYCRFCGLKEPYLSQFRPASGAADYQSFQDFFTRKFKEELAPEASRIWPCEGMLCDQGWIGTMKGVEVKGHYRAPWTIFGSLGKQIPESHYFANIFLHNNDYHRIHAPVSGQVQEVEYLRGELVVLRPWIYEKKPSLPAFRNERVNLRMEDANGAPWFLSIVGGPAVGGIQLREKVKQKERISCGEELGTFLLGSTLCLAAPIDKEPLKTGARVTPGLPI